MSNPETTAMLRAVLDELCLGISRYDASTRTNVASKLLEAVRLGKPSIDELKQIGKRALLQAAAMSRLERGQRVVGDRNSITLGHVS